MKKDYKNAFTLVELLAVIVILAVILIISVPQMLSTIKKSKLSVMESSAKLIAKNADQDYLVQKTLNSNYSATSIPCSDVVKISDDYESCNIQYDENGISTVTLVGKEGKKFDGIVCVGTKDNMDCDTNIIVNNTVAYFMPFDGTDGLFGFDKANITEFSRNTTLTENEVKEKSGVINIKNVSDDEYNSEYDIYGWVENNKFYWWSNSNMIYFHPNTVKPFYNYAKLVTVDLTDTSTELVKNFAHWFDTSRKLQRIVGKIKTDGLELAYNDSFNYVNDSNENNSANIGLAFMFNDCNSLEYVDLSGFDTHNATDMKRMFGGCNKLSNIDLTHFDTSNVRSMYWMFRKANALTELDLTSFDTSNVLNFYEMFVGSTNLNTILLGDNFNTSNATKLNGMFYNMPNLTSIYAKRDFIKSTSATTSKMFTSDKKLIGAYGTSYQTNFNTSKIDGTYARIASSTQNGYFTLYKNEPIYSINYDLDGGLFTTNPYKYFESDPTITLVNPTKQGYKFIGWTGSNGDTPQLTVTIPAGSTGNKNYTAHYVSAEYDIIFNSNGGTGTMPNQHMLYGEAKFLNENLYTRDGYKFVEWNTKADGSGISYLNKLNITNLTDSEEITLYAQWTSNLDFNRVFNVTGPCMFNAQNSNITGSCPDYSDKTFINTGVRLYNNENYLKDYEIYFKIDEFKSTAQNSETQHTIINSKYELENAGYPGLVFRNASTNQYELTQTIKSKKETALFNYANVSTIKIIRRKNKYYYSINDNGVYLFQDTNGNTQIFDTPVTFGASLRNGNENTPFRFSVIKLSNMYIKLGSYYEK